MWRKSIGTRMKFTVRDLMTLTLIASLVTVCGAVYWELMNAREEVRRLRTTQHLPIVEDKARIHAIRVPSEEASSWRWNLYVPSSHKSLLCIAIGEVQMAGVPDANWSEELVPQAHSDGAVSLGMRLYVDGNGALRLKVVIDDDERAVLALPPSYEKWLARNSQFVFDELGMTTAKKSPGRPLVLFRTIKDDDGKVALSDPATEGIVVWISTPQE